MHPDPTGSTAAAGALDHRLGRRVGAPVRRARGHPLGRVHGRARRGVDLLVVVQLDDLGRFEVGRGQLGEAHHQHGPDGEVGGHEAVAAGEAGGELLIVGGREPRRADHGMDAVRRAPRQVGPGRVDVGEVDRHLGLGPRQGLDVGRHLQPPQLGAGHAPEVDAGVERVDCGDEQQLGIGHHRPADRRPHPSAGPEHPHTNRHLGTIS